MELERYAPAILARHKDPLASVTTVLNRLVDYGEARSLSNDRGRRVWEWISESESPMTRWLRGERPERRQSRLRSAKPTLRIAKRTYRSAELGMTNP